MIIIFTVSYVDDDETVNKHPYELELEKYDTGEDKTDTRSFIKQELVMVKLDTEKIIEELEQLVLTVEGEYER